MLCLRVPTRAAMWPVRRYFALGDFPDRRVDGVEKSSGFVGSRHGVLFSAASTSPS